ncbi:hemicentin-1 isoform X2 [Misgurnus anguillicaudatus]|uniref:hemicentin-1 isoform X2 n=1 Tax=Misgurnus anguillicaudatus TaxID=75329 RepID=UPI003CCF6AC1
MNCSSNGYPAVVNYTWYRANGGQLQLLQTGNNLTINVTTAAQRGRYYCVAQNKYGQQNTSILLDVLFSPKNTSISGIPSSTVLEGNPVTLNCSSEANPPNNYTLYRDIGGRLQLIQTGFNLSYRAINRTQSGRYYCVAQNKYGQQNSSVLLDIQYPPNGTSISVSPSSTILEGNPVSMNCSSNGYPAVVNYTWYRANGGQLQLLQTGNNLTINVTTAAQRGRYYCVAQNKYGQQNTSILLDVLFSPKNTSISGIPSSTVLEGNPVTLNCSSEANPPNNYTLYREIGGRLQLIQIRYNFSYSVTNRTQSGRYYCVAQNKYGQQNSSVLLDIQYPPNGTSISVSPSSTILEGNPVSMNCSSNGNPMVNYTWYRANGGQLQLLQTGNNLTINVTTAAQRGRYYCVAQNKYGQQNTSILLDVLFSPKNTSISAIPSSTVLEGNPVTLNCSSEANPPNNYTLYRDNGGQLQLIQIGYNFSYSITYRAQSGRYYCVAQNKYGQQNSSVLLDIQYPPNSTSISVTPSSTVLEGNPVTLNCSSNGNPVVNYTWYRENGGQLQQLQTGNTLTINVTTAAQSGQYYCVAQNKYGQQNSSVLLDVQFPPKTTSILAIPSSIVIEGNPVTLNCSSEANPANNYTWYRDNGGQLQLIQTGNNLTISVTNPEHRGWYYCVAQNKYGQQNSSVLLDVLFSPENTSISAIPSSIVLEGNPVTLNCSSDANPALINYTWYKENGGHLQLLQTEYNFTISVTNRTQSGQYYCVAENTQGQQNSSILLDIQYPPSNTSILAIPSSAVLEGNPVTLICSTDANPPLVNYTWYIDNGDLNVLQTGYILTYNVTNVTQTDEYYCVAENMYGQENSSVFLDIQYPPRNTSISVTPSSTVLEGNPVTLNCNTNANPQLVNYTWYRDNGGQLQLLQTGNNITITITNPAHRGWYYCVAQNIYGQQTSSAFLDILFSPKNTSISAIPSSIVLEASSLSLICSANANPAVFSYTWYRDNGGQLQLIQTGNNFTISVTNRTQSGRYYCQAQNKYGQQSSSVLLDVQCL